MSHTHYVLGSLHYNLVLILITYCAPAIQTLLSTFHTLLHLILMRLAFLSPMYSAGSGGSDRLHDEPI